MSDTQFWVTVGVWNLIVFSMYGYDKLCAIKGYDRISEFTLLFLAFAFGGVGALLGMVLWRHKTLKIKFKWSIPHYTPVRPRASNHLPSSLRQAFTIWSNPFLSIALSSFSILPNG